MGDIFALCQVQPGDALVMVSWDATVSTQGPDGPPTVALMIEDRSAASKALKPALADRLDYVLDAGVTGLVATCDDVEPGVPAQWVLEPAVTEIRPDPVTEFGTDFGIVIKGYFDAQGVPVDTSLVEDLAFYLHSDEPDQLRPADGSHSGLTLSGKRV